MVALWKKELKRYFASSIYVTNTIVVYMLALLAAAAILLIGIEKIVASAGIPNLDKMIVSGMPFGVALLMTMSTISACSISMEGNTFWQIQTLPVRSKDVYDSKILVNLAVAAPFYVLSVLLLALATKPSLLDFIWLIIIPACYIVFMAVMGITVNLAFPVLKWESEVRVVKQGASTLVVMLFSMVGCIVPMVGVILLDDEMANVVRILTVVVVLLLTVLLYRKNNKKELLELV